MEARNHDIDNFRDICEQEFWLKNIVKESIGWR